MAMIIKFEFPPNYAEIDAKFKLTALKATVDVRPVFAYAPYCYNPYREPLGEEIMQHEATHILRQNGDPIGWWRKYIDDQEFRLDEELPAHVIEYHVRIRQAEKRETFGRPERRAIMNLMATRLCHQLYGYVPRIPIDRARGLLKKAIKE